VGYSCAVGVLQRDLEVDRGFGVFSGGIPRLPMEVTNIGVGEWEYLWPGLAISCSSLAVVRGIRLPLARAWSSCLV